jgi:hypothetical protein
LPHRALLLRTESAHASPNLQWYRTQRLALLHVGSDFARLVVRDLCAITRQYAQPAAADQLSGAVVAESAEADEHAGRGRRRTI